MSRNGGGGGGGPIPPRWLECPRKSVALIDNRFIAFKTPLSSKFNDEVPNKNRFTPEMLFDSMSSQKVCFESIYGTKLIFSLNCYIFI